MSSQSEDSGADAPLINLDRPGIDLAKVAALTPDLDCSPFSSEEVARATVAELPSLFTKEDVVQFTDWMGGGTSGPPEALSKMLNNIASRLSWAMSYTIMEMLVRVQTLSSFLRRCEQRLFDPETVLEYQDPMALLEVYKQGMRTQMECLEFTRKFIVQNRDTIEGITTEVDEVKEMLSELSPARLRALKGVLLTRSTKSKEKSTGGGS